MRKDPLLWRLLEGCLMNVIVILGVALYVLQAFCDKAKHLK